MTSSENFDPGRIRSARDKVYGVRVTMPSEDPLRNLLGADWHSVRWFATEAERDAALEDMRQVHRFSRRGDRPSLVYQKIDAPKPSGPSLPRSA
jgi:hypothetical protein